MLQHTLPLVVFFQICVWDIQHSQDYNNKIAVNYTCILNFKMLPWQLSVVIGNWALNIRAYGTHCKVCFSQISVDCKWPYRWFMQDSYLCLWWPTTVMAKTKNLTAKTKYLTAKPKTSWQKQTTSRQKQKPHGKTKDLTAKPNTSQQKPNTSRQKQIPTAKLKLFCYFVFAMRFLVLRWQLWATISVTNQSRNKKQVFEDNKICSVGSKTATHWKLALVVSLLWKINHQPKGDSLISNR